METYRPVGNGMGRGTGRPSSGSRTRCSRALRARRRRANARGSSAATTVRRSGSRRGLAARRDLERRSETRAHVLLLARLNPSELCQIPPVRGRSADRRGVQRHPSAGHDVGPQAPSGRLASPRREAFTVCAPGDARLSALHRGGLLASGPARDESLHDGAVARRSLACELLASARSGGGRCSGASRATGCMTRLAGRRIPACLKRCLATSTLGGRDRGI